jgi:hypothetical protein
MQVENHTVIISFIISRRQRGFVLEWVKTRNTIEVIVVTTSVNRCNLQPCYFQDEGLSCSSFVAILALNQR